MTQTSKTVWWIVGLVIVVIIIVVVSRGGSNNSGPIKIGFIGPLTGGAAPYGEPSANAVKIAVGEINAAGGVNSRPLQVIYEDGKCSGPDAAGAAQKLVNIDKVKYLIGGGCSGESFSVVPIITAAKVLAISPISSAPKLSGSSPYFIRNNPNDNLFGPSLADFLASSSYKTVATISEQTDYAQGIKTVFLAELQKDGLASADVEDFTSDTTDFRTILSKVRDSKPDVLFINAKSGANFIHIAQQARQLGIKAQLANVYLGTDPLIASSTDLLNGAVFADLPGLSTEKGKQFMASYQSAYGSLPPYPFYAGAAYDDVYLITDGIKSVGDDPTKVMSYLHSLPNYTGAIGTYSFDQNGDISGYKPLFQKIVDGKLVNL